MRMDKVKLFCFPFSGGSSAIYLSLFKRISPQIEILPVELPGRSKRFSEKPLECLESAALDLYQGISDNLDNSYAFFGHSLGCLLIYELMQIIARNNRECPIHIFLSGGIPPHFKGKTDLHTYSDQEFLTEIIRMGGIPESIVENKEFLNFFLPLIRSDYKMYETYTAKADFFKFPCAITALSGTKDYLANFESSKNWSLYTMKSCSHKLFEGDHFFIKSHSEEVGQLIEKVLTENYE